MADGEDNLTEAERRRVRRRQRILENQGARMDRILGGSSKSSSSSDVKGYPEEDDDMGPSSKAGFDSVSSVPESQPGPSSTPKNAKSSTSSSSTVHSKKSAKEKSEPTNLPHLLKELSEDFTGLQSPTITSSGEVRMGIQADGSVIMARIPHHIGRFLICGLALFLSLFKAKQFAVTFFSWEVAYYILNGLPPYPPPNTVLVTLALVGVKEVHLQRFKKVIHILDCAATDFSLFLTFVMMPHIVKSVIQVF